MVIKRYNILLIAFLSSLACCQTTFFRFLALASNTNIAPCAKASSGDGEIKNFDPGVMNGGIEKEECSYHWIRTHPLPGQKKGVWILLDWDEDATVTNMTI